MDNYKITYNYRRIICKHCNIGYVYFTKMLPKVVHCTNCYKPYVGFASWGEEIIYEYIYG
jgi:hypothetical protein